jgi:two-component system, NtrC family, response regulator AtoC
MRHSGRRKNGHTSARDARTECSEIKTLARLAVDRPGERFLHTRALPFLVLASHFLSMYAAANARPVTGIAPAAMSMLVGYEWPGNIRELEHAIERAVALTTHSVVQPEDLPPRCVEAVATPDPPGSPLSLRGVVTRHVRRVLREARWNKKLAAQLLGVHRRTLYRLTKRYGITLSERGPDGTE